MKSVSMRDTIRDTTHCMLSWKQRPHPPDMKLVLGNQFTWGPDRGGQRRRENLSSAQYSRCSVARSSSGSFFVSVSYLSFTTADTSCDPHCWLYVV